MNIVDIAVFNSHGLIPVVTQDYKTGKVLMLAYANKEALEKTVDSGKVHYFSRSRNKLWMKGESSGHIQKVKEIFFDCDCDTVLIKVDQAKAACHAGYYSCFYRRLGGDDLIEVSEKVFDEDKTYGK